MQSPLIGGLTVVPLMILQAAGPVVGIALHALLFMVVLAAVQVAWVNVLCTEHVAVLLFPAAPKLEQVAFVP
jgi:hypothetical protein